MKWEVKGNGNKVDERKQEKRKEQENYIKKGMMIVNEKTVKNLNEVGQNNKVNKKREKIWRRQREKKQEEKEEKKTK